MHHQHAGPARREHSGHHLGQVGERAADQSGRRLARIGQRPQQIEDRGHPDLASRRRRVPVGRVKPGCEAEADTDFSDAARHLVRLEVDAHPQRLERVGTAGKRRRSPVAVLDHRDTGGRHHDGRHRGQVDGVDAVAAGADDVHGCGARAPRLPARRWAAGVRGRASRRPARRPRPRSAPSSASRRRTPRSAPVLPRRS